MKTFYEVLNQIQSTSCNVAESEIENGYMSDNSTFRKIVQESIDRAYVLGEIIDSLPVELAESEV